jgi:NMD protein affecting ribosome stability and mRNA decay
MGLMNIDDAELPELPEGFKYMPCRHCGKSVVTGAKRVRTVAHVECSMKVATDNVRQIHDKKGPYYDRWLAGQAAYLTRLTLGGAPPQERG